MYQRQKILKESKNTKPTSEDCTNFNNWLEDQHYKKAHKYRLALLAEIEAAKKVMGKQMSLYLPVLISSLKQIAVPNYEPYTGSLDKETQMQLFNAAKKPDYIQILHDIIKQELTATATDIRH